VAIRQDLFRHVASRVRCPNGGERCNDPRACQHIFDYGIDGRFYGSIRKYHHEGGKVYWTMDSSPETTALVNRCDEDQTYEVRLVAGTLPK